MDDTSIAPDSDAQDSYKAEVPVTLAALQIEGQSPEVGDEVELTVKGTVSRIHEDTACVTPVEVNGEPVPPVPPPDSMDMASDHDMLMRGAEQDDQGY